MEVSGAIPKAAIMPNNGKLDNRISQRDFLFPGAGTLCRMDALLLSMLPKWLMRWQV
jgi:hypothetical protein